MPNNYQAAKGILVLLILLCACWSSNLLAKEPSQRAREFQVKALFLYNFANFVEWPDKAFENENSPLRMCLFGAVPFGEFLDVVDGVPIRNRILNVLRTADEADISQGCHILFVGVDRIEKLQELFQDVNHLFVLSVGNTDGFADQGGGVINIYRTQDKQKFEINLQRAIERGLFINSDLLSLARIINADK